MGQIPAGLLEQLKKSAVRHGSCDPLWLHEGREPEIKTTQPESTTGPEVVLLHGLFGALSNWDSLLPLVTSFCKPIALNFPITTCHRSEGKVKALSVHTEFFVRTRNLQPVTLCGNSMGGHVAMRLCLSAPELVDCLILSGSSGLYEHSVDSLPIRPDQKFVREHMARVFFNPKFITDSAVNEVHSILKNRKFTLNLIHAARSAKKDNLLTLLNQIKVPVLLLWGEDDQITTMSVAEQFQKNIPNAKLVTIKNCGHAPMIEHPEWFAGEVEKFLKQHSRFYKNA